MASLLAGCDLEDGAPSARQPASGLCARPLDRFFRAAPMDIDGTGLGLAIARTAADRNGFSLDIANRDDAQGVRAAVSIPLGEVPNEVRQFEAA